MGIAPSWPAVPDCLGLRGFPGYVRVKDGPGFRLSVHLHPFPKLLCGFYPLSGMSLRSGTRDLRFSLHLPFFTGAGPFFSLGLSFPDLKNGKHGQDDSLRAH